MLGYANQNHFNLAFKKCYRTTPLKYKKDWTKYYESFEDVNLNPHS